MTHLRCSNCQERNATVADRSLDLDLPTLRLCSMCSHLLVADPDMFLELEQPAPQEKSS